MKMFASPFKFNMINLASICIKSQISSTFNELDLSEEWEESFEIWAKNTEFSFLKDNGRIQISIH